MSMKMPRLILITLFVFYLSGANGQVTLLSPSALSMKRDYKNLQDALSQPDSVYRLSLIDVNLSHSKVPFDTFTHLQSLRLYNNELTILPNGLVNLTYLQELSIYENNITSLPSTIQNLVYLRKFEMNFNALTQLPVQIGTLTTITEMDLRYNRIYTLPNEIKHLVNLKTLNLSGNLFSYSERIKIQNLLPNCRITF
jgi:Leucine-rich repeat (LRR) protein